MKSAIDQSVNRIMITLINDSITEKTKDSVTLGDKTAKEAHSRPIVRHWLNNVAKNGIIPRHMGDQHDS